MILVVIEVSNEDIYWVSVTNNQEILEKVRDSSTDTLTVHLPVENKLEKNDSVTFDQLLEAVQESWDFLSLRDLKLAVSNCQTLQPEALNTRIEQVGDALFRAYHIKLEQLMVKGSYPQVFKQAGDLINSPVVPSKDRFIAALYYFFAFDIQPYTQLKSDEALEKLKLCDYLVRCAREQRESTYRLTAIAKARYTVFFIKIEQLNALHHTNDHFKTDSFEFLYMNRAANTQYHEACVSLQKIINLCHRLIRQSQFNILADVMKDLTMSIGMFKSIHKARGTDDAITFLDEWFESMIYMSLTYLAMVKDLGKIEQLYLLISIQKGLKEIVQFDMRELILDHFPDLQELLDRLDSIIASQKKPKSLFEASIEEQKQFFADMAKNLGMDPDDSSSIEGQFIAIGLANYDPTNIIGHCEHMFVDYRPRGMIAQQLGMHSLSMPIMTCLKHKQVIGTGNLLIKAFNNSDGPEFALGFKQKYCDKCSDYSPRSDDWVWNLKWQQEKRTKHVEWLDKIDF